MRRLLGIAAVATAAALAAVLALRRPQTAASAEALVLARRSEALARLVETARRGPLLPFRDLLVVADERLVAGVLAASLPYERVLRDRYRVRVTRAEAHFEDGLGLVVLEGQASFAGRPEEEGRADLTVYGGLDVVELDPASGVLRGAVKVFAVDARQVGAYGVRSRLAEDLVEQLGREQLESYGALASRIEIPVSLERSVALPAVGPGEVQIEAATIPVRASVVDVKAFRGRLWVSVDVGASPAPPAAGSP